MLGCGRGLLAAGLFGWFLLSPAAAAPVEESWEGDLKVGQVSLRLVLNVVKADNGSVSATFDSPDQGAAGLAVDSVSLDKKTLTFEMKRIMGKFEGQLNAAGTEAKGTWSQGPQSFPLTLTKKAKKGSVPGGKEQLWEGKLSVGAGLQLRVVIHVSKAADGTLSATMDSPDQGAKGLRVDSVTIDKTKMTLNMKNIGASFEGKLDASGTIATGEWKQGPNKLPLTLKLTEKVTELKRPQTPKPPFAYVSEDVTYDNPAGKVKLAGTLTRPKGKGPFPAVILISGSGAQDRDETLFEHKPFAVLADALTKRGVAVLRVDDRGVGGSTGSMAKSTTEDFAGDVLAGVAYLKTRPEIDKAHIGLMGHSEGGVIAPMVAAKSKDVAFIVLLAGTGLPGDEILQLQGQLILESLGVGKSVLERQAEIQKKLLGIVKSEPDNAKAEAKMKEALAEIKKKLSKAEIDSLEGLDGAVDGQLALLRSPWFRYFLSYDPRPTLQKVKCPVLAVVGEKDLQVPPKQNLSEIEKALKAGGNRHATVKELPSLNHLFQTAKTGSTAEYAQIEETIAPAALKVLGDWVVQTTGQAH